MTTKEVNVLIIDDIEANSELFERRVRFYSEGIFIVNELKRSWIPDEWSNAPRLFKEPVDMIFMDMDLIHDLTGRLLIEQYRKYRLIDYRTQVCFYTAHDALNKEMEKKMFGNDFYIRKDWDSDKHKVVFQAMYNKLLSCKLSHLFPVKSELFLHEIFDVTLGKQKKSGVINYPYINSKEQMLSGISFKGNELEMEEWIKQLHSYDILQEIGPIQTINKLFLDRTWSETTGGNKHLYFLLVKDQFKVVYEGADTHHAKLHEVFEFPKLGGLYAELTRKEDEA